MLRSGQTKYKAPVTVTANYTILANDDDIICNGSGTIKLVLPAASSFSGRRLRIKTIADQSVVSADADGTLQSNVAPIDSATAGSAILPAYKGSFVELSSDGTNWVAMMFYSANKISY